MVIMPEQKRTKIMHDIKEICSYIQDELEINSEIAEDGLQDQYSIGHYGYYEEYFCYIDSGWGSGCFLLPKMEKEIEEAKKENLETLLSEQNITEDQFFSYLDQEQNIKDKCDIIFEKESDYALENFNFFLSFRVSKTGFGDIDIKVLLCQEGASNQELLKLRIKSKFYYLTEKQIAILVNRKLNRFISNEWKKES